ncbi:hypothetical protein PGT21_022338 [Puccinia graminis f. sp. tritici]|uniref:Uncharacterized protein n=2 Tax=Puccinia graminis f. sp. tritici TaxID=56615 RepID=E3KDP1_PUCGT|nr:uncharacterized protein PGTG_08433 [Puccinia graminis f. sp. tritici CRL 75-36-700-3]EFP82477.1 hypothetical protein PGTG_08433 [Puccinia graminis f. sp. tritici CRL 75-36-700-3]KAA1079720.1 hypothetical protein PGT21_022338 [Puccinia graminis f. sp. tritici]KAA1100816.1 hypothetical protein PGTUg99_029000 [Puccinia graminis f. sp. tritici]
MQFLPALISLLACLSFATRIAASSHGADPSPLSKVFIMKKEMDYSQGSLHVYAADGTIVYRFLRTIQDPITGFTTVFLESSPSKAFFVYLQSPNSLCGHKTNYTQLDAPGARKMQFTIEPNNFRKDKWSFSYVDGTGTQQNFKFDRNYASQEGEIRHQINGQDGNLVAELRNQKRTDSWLTSSSVGEVDTYTLSCTADSPQVELILLMGLVISRVHDCGS